MGQYAKKETKPKSELNWKLALSILIILALLLLGYVIFSGTNGNETKNETPNTNSTTALLDDQERIEGVVNTFAVAVVSGNKTDAAGVATQEVVKKLEPWDPFPGGLFPGDTPQSYIIDGPKGKIDIEIGISDEQIKIIKANKTTN